MSDDEEQDVIELLAAHNPAPPDRYADFGSTPRAEALLDRIMAADRERVPWWRRGTRRRRRIVIVPVIGVLAVALSAGTYTATRSPSVPQQVTCYSGASTTDRGVVMGATGESAVAACASAWRHGELGGSSAPPPLVPCVLGSGALAVFPSDTEAICSALGLASAEPLTKAERQQARLVHDLESGAVGKACLTPTAARSRAIADLRKVGLKGWHVQLLGSATIGRCATFAVSSSSQSVIVRGLP